VIRTNSTNRSTSILYCRLLALRVSLSVTLLQLTGLRVADTRVADTPGYGGEFEGCDRSFGAVLRRPWSLGLTGATGASTPSSSFYRRMRCGQESMVPEGRPDWGRLLYGPGLPAG
jgi:hypothetical protein